MEHLVHTTGRGMYPGNGTYNLELNYSANNDAGLENHVTIQNSDVLILSLILDVLVVYVMPVVTTMGLTLNSITSRFLLKSDISINQYFGLLCITNSITLLCYFLKLLEVHGLFVMAWSGMCNIQTFLSSTAEQLNNWYIVAVLFDRLIYYAYPSLRTTVCVKSRAQMLIIGWFIIAVVIHINLTVTMGVVMAEGKAYCMPIKTIYNNPNVTLVVKLIFNVIMPDSVLIILGVALVCTACVTCRNTPGQTSGGATQDSALCATTIAYIAIHVTSYMPSELYRCIYLLRGILHPAHTTSPAEYFSQAYLYHAHYAGQALHFFIHISLQPSFRKIIMARLRGVCKRQADVTESRGLGARRMSQIDIAPETNV